MTLLSLWILSLPLGPRAAQASELDDRVTALVADGSPAAQEALVALANAGERPVPAAARGLLALAEAQLLAGDRARARRLANDLWLSSAPHEVRLGAWRVLFLTEPPARMRAPGHPVELRSRGGRDHDRFVAWLRTTWLEPYPWIVDVEVAWEPTLLAPDRADESVRITFVIDDPGRTGELVARLAGARGGTFQTHDWTRLDASPLAP